MIYFIQIKQSGPIKIGYAKNPQRRLKELEGASPYPLRLLLVLNDENEKKFHQQFKQSKINREWFKPSKELLTFIAKYNFTPWAPKVKKKIKPKSRKMPNKKGLLISQKIKSIRVNSKKILFELKRIGWSQEKLADEVGRTKQAISYLLKRRTAPLRTLNLIGKALKVDPKELLI